MLPLLSHDGRLARKIREILPGQELCVLDDLNALILWLETHSAPAALVDMENLGDLRPLEKLTRRFAATRFILLAQDLRPELLLRAMEIGARHYILKNSMAEELPVALQRIVCHGSDAPGTMYLVLSAGGGCGATTLAVNLAQERAEAGPSLLIDLDRFYGAALSFVGGKSSYGIQDVLNHPGAIDEQLIASTRLIVSPRLHLLAMNDPEAFPESPAPERLEELLHAAQLCYGTLVVDAPRQNRSTQLLLARQAEKIFLVLQMNLKDLRTGRRMLDSLRHEGIRHCQVVVSRFRRGESYIELEEAQRALGCETLLSLCSDYASASKALDFGQPLAQAAPRSALRRDILRMLEKGAQK